VAKRVQNLTGTGGNSGSPSTTTIHTDFLGSPVAETNSAGTVTRVERYTPYGEPADMQLDAGPGFTGHATDVATGLTYMQQRYYDPEIHRFNTPDPVGPEEDFIKHFNRYNYALNNPVRYTDPDGRDSRARGGNRGGLTKEQREDIKYKNEQTKDMIDAGNAVTGISLTVSGSSEGLKKVLSGIEIAPETASGIKSLARTGTAVDLAVSGTEIIIGLKEGDNSAVAHGGTTGVISVLTLVGVLQPEIGGTALVIDAVAQNVTYEGENGKVVNGWEAVGKHLEGMKNTYECGKPCW